MLCGSSTLGDFGSRRKRRDEVKSILARLIAIRKAEQATLDNVPENLQNSESSEIGEQAVDILDKLSTCLQRSIDSLLFPRSRPYAQFYRPLSRSHIAPAQNREFPTMKKGNYDDFLGIFA